MDVSVIIPCYNSGRYLADALQSVAESVNISGYSYEVIIINDGSTEQLTLDFLKRLNPMDYIVLHQDNKGPAAARNTGIKAASGHTLLFLDSDNKIRKNFMEKGLKMLNATKADIVYGKPAFFGATNLPRFKTGKFDMGAMLIVNHIDICSMVRKSVWEQLGGLDEDRMLIAFEDWEFWIRAGAAGYKFHFINETMFDYRITNNSLLDDKNSPENHQKVVEHIYKKHNDLILKTYRKVVPEYVVLKRDARLPLRTFIKHLYNKYLKATIDINRVYERY